MLLEPCYLRISNGSWQGNNEPARTGSRVRYLFVTYFLVASAVTYSQADPSLVEQQADSFSPLIRFRISSGSRKISFLDLGARRVLLALVLTNFLTHFLTDLIFSILEPIQTQKLAKPKIFYVENVQKCSVF